jgi:flagellar biosynthetic protein FliO
VDNPGLSLALSSVVSLIVILGALVGATYLARRLRNTGWGQRASTQNNVIKLIATRPLGPQSSLVIVEAEGKRFLVGISRTGMTAIGRVDE